MNSVYQVEGSKPIKREGQPLTCCLVMICISIFVLLLFRDVGEYSISKWILFAVAILAFLLLDANYTAIFVCFLIPFTVGLPNSYIYAGGLLIYAIKNFERLVINQYVLALVALMTIEMLSFIYGSFSIMEYVRLFAPVLLISIIIFNDGGELNYRHLVWAFLLALVGAEISVIWQSINVGGLNELVSSGVRLGNTSELLLEEGIRVKFNPNVLGYLCAISISILLTLLTGTTRFKPLLALLLGFEIYMGLMTVSRTFLVLLGLIAVVYVLSRASSPGALIRGLVLTSLVTVGAFGAVQWLSPDLIDSISDRLAVDDLSAGRVGILTEYSRVMAVHPERLFLGVGLQQYPYKWGMPDSCHNGLQEIVATWGIIGLVLVGIYIFGIYTKGVDRLEGRRPSILNVLPLIVLLVAVQGGQFFSSNASLYLLPIYASLRLSRTAAESQ